MQVIHLQYEVIAEIVKGWALCLKYWINQVILIHSYASYLLGGCHFCHYSLGTQTWHACLSSDPVQWSPSQVNCLCKVRHFCEVLEKYGTSGALSFRIRYLPIQTTGLLRKTHAAYHNKA